MGRLVAVLSAVAMLAVGCGDDLAAPAVAPSTTENGVVGTVELCADASVAPPQALPVGVVTELPDNGADHVVCASYDRSPPASGDHFPAWQNCGFYAAPVQPQTAVHSLEHGAVWVAYQPDLDPVMVAEIQGRMSVERHGLIAPFPGLANPIVLTAWTRQLAVDNWSDPAVEPFLVTFLGEASPTAPEAGVSCEGAVGTAPGDPDANFAQIFEEVSGS